MMVACVFMYTFGERWPYRHNFLLCRVAHSLKNNGALSTILGWGSVPESTVVLKKGLDFTIIMLGGLVVSLR